jgi:hypothetical protein
MAYIPRPTRGTYREGDIGPYRGGCGSYSYALSVRRTEGLIGGPEVDRFDLRLQKCVCVYVCVYVYVYVYRMYRRR